MASTAADDLMNQVAQEKRICEEKKKKCQEEKKAEEESFKSKREKTINQAIAVATTISPPTDTNSHGANYDSNLDLTNALFAVTLAKLIAYGKETLGQSNKAAELYIAHIEEQNQAIKLVKQQALCLDTMEAEEHLARHGMCPNLLFGMDLETPTGEATAQVVHLSGTSPKKKKSKSAAGVLQTDVPQRCSITPLLHMSISILLPMWKPPSA
jgi:hypothetical protein